MYINHKHLMMLANALDKAGFKKHWLIDEPCVIAQTTTDSPPVIIKNIYLGRGNTKSDSVDLRPLQVLHELGIDVKICYNFDVTHLYDLSQLKDVGPIFQFTAGTILTYKTKLRRKITELRLVEDDPTQAGPIRDDIHTLTTKLTAVGELDDTLLALLSPTPPQSTITTAGVAETVDQRMLRMAREGEEAHASELALREMEKHVAEGTDIKPIPLLDVDDAAAITNSMLDADQVAQNTYEQSLREKGDEK